MLSLKGFTLKGFTLKALTIAGKGETTDEGLF